MSGIICYENVDICYNGSPVIKKVSFSAEKGEILGIAGESGSGKSTLIKAAIGLLGKNGSVTGGKIWYEEKNLLDLNETIAKDLFEGKTYPWEVLPEIGDFILKLGQTLSEEEYNHPSEDVWIAKSAKVAPTACINGPVIIGKEAEVRHCAFIRGKAIVGEGAVVGNSTELKNAVLFNKVQVPHYNYVGDAVLGYKSHMGAGSICSNVKSDKRLVIVKDGEEKIETGLKKFGAMLGDNVEVGCGSVLNPGTVIGRCCNIYPLSSVRGCVPANHIYKSKAEIVEKQ